MSVLTIMNFPSKGISWSNPCLEPTIVAKHIIYTHNKELTVT